MKACLRVDFSYSLADSLRVFSAAAGCTGPKKIAAGSGPSSLAFLGGVFLEEKNKKAKGKYVKFAKNACSFFKMERLRPLCVLALFGPCALVWHKLSLYYS